MRSSILGAFLVLASLAPCAGADPPSAGKEGARELAAKIDRHLEARWRAEGVRPALPADDAEFCRRVYLDLTGRIPTILEIRDFLDNPAKDKRQRLIASLLEDERTASHFATVWGKWLLPPTDNRPFVAAALEPWLARSFRDNLGYDRMAKDLLLGTAGQTFYQANNFQAEDLAAATSRFFLGVNLECAQCHDHPFAGWKRTQFWEFAAFFADLARTRNPLADGPAEIAIPGTDRTVQARFLGADGPAVVAGKNPREVLAEWMTGPDNPYFARATVNRVWEYFFGTGLVEPIEEMNADNPPSHPELLDELAREFAARNFDLRFLVRALTTTRAYQLTSRSTHESQADPTRFARMQVRTLSAEQLFDSLAIATGHADRVRATSLGNPSLRDPAREEFLRRFPDQGKRSEAQTSILQALYLMNGKLVTEATSLEHNRNLDVIAASSVPVPRKVEQLFLVTLSRKPTPEESARLVEYVTKGGPTGDRNKALTDVFWALLNTGEFTVNH